jgi:hypothetical protein
MKINYASHSSFEKATNEKFDFIICASGYEKRASYFYSRFCETYSHPCEKISLSFKDRISLSRDENDIFFKDHLFTPIVLESGNLKELIEIYSEIFSHTNDDSIKILFDYSCMTKVMYAALLKYFDVTNDLFEEVTIYFVYTEALFSEPIDTNSNLHNQPLLFPTVELTDKKIALIVGLGYEKGKAQGLIEHMQIENPDTYLFYTSKSNDEQFYNKIIENNSYILTKIPEKNHFQYEQGNTTYTLNLLESLCNYLLSKDYRVIIAPLGPKLFSLISILLYIKYSDLTVLRVSPGIKGVAIERLPNTQKSPNIIEVNFNATSKQQI